jgi:small redox-active disulfide protein 2
LRIEVLGSGCAKCKRQVQVAERVVKELGLEAEVVKVEDISEIIERGVMMTPALYIDGELKSSGRIVETDELKRMLMSHGLSPSR